MNNSKTYLIILQDFLDELFARGVDNPSAKVTAREAQNLMRTARKDGRKRFKAPQLLEEEQIDGYFSRRLANIKAGKNPRKRKADDSDILQQKVEEAVSDRKKSCKDILDQMDVDEQELATFHPLPTGPLNMKFCLLAADLKSKGTTGTLKISRFSKAEIAEAMDLRGLEIPQDRGTKRRMNEVILAYVEQHCLDDCLSLIQGTKIDIADEADDDVE